MAYKDSFWSRTIFKYIILTTLIFLQGEHSTVFQTEIVLIEKAATYLLGHILEGKKFLSTVTVSRLLIQLTPKL